MQYSDYLQQVFLKANDICQKYNINNKFLESIYIAMLWEFKNDYETISPLDKIGNSLYLEKERMCYIISKCVASPKPNILEHCLKRQLGAEVTQAEVEDTLNKAENLAKERRQEFVSADILLFFILQKIPAPFNSGTVKDLKIIEQAFFEAEENAKAFMEQKLSQTIKNREIENQKAKELEKLINRKPQEKIGEEDEIKQQLLDLIKIEHLKNFSTITLPYYFPFSDKPLTLTLFEKDGRVFVTDCGRAYSELTNRLTKPQARKMAKYFLRINFESELNLNNHLIAPISSVKRFFDFLQVVSIVANADMYPQIDNERYCEYKKYSKKYKFNGKTQPTKDFINQLKESIKVNYDADKGITVHTPFYFNDEACPMCLSIEKDGEQAVIENFGDFDGGRLFQRIEWLNENVHLIDNDILNICKRFSCDYENEKISLRVQKEQVYEGIFTFMQTASILGEIGNYIILQE